MCQSYALAEILCWCMSDCTCTEEGTHSLIEFSAQFLLVRQSVYMEVGFGGWCSSSRLAHFFHFGCRHARAQSISQFLMIYAWGQSCPWKRIKQWTSMAQVESMQVRLQLLFVGENGYHTNANQSPRAFRILVWYFECMLWACEPHVSHFWKIG